MALRRWAAHVLAISPGRRHRSLLSLQSPVKTAEPVWNPWKAYSLFWRHPPHSSCLCDPITAVHYPPSTRTRLYVLSANVDSALCSTASRAGSADWWDLKERKNKGEKNSSSCWRMCPPACPPAASPAVLQVTWRVALAGSTWSREDAQPRAPEKC